MAKTVAQHSPDAGQAHSLSGPLAQAAEVASSKDGVSMDERLIFLLGLPRSGTTLYQTLLAQHPEVHAESEPWLLLAPLLSLQDGEITSPSYNTTIAHRAVRHLLNSCDDGDEVYFRAVRKMASEVYEAILAPTGKAYFLDKTPNYYMIIEPLLRTFPHAKSLLLLRDPLWVLASIAQTWCRGRCDRVFSHPYHRRTVLEGPHAIADNLDTVRSRGLVTRYEDLVVEPERELKATCDYLDLKFEETMLSYDPEEMGRRPLGDRWGITNHSAPVRTSLTIPKVLQTPRNKQLAIEYMRYLGPDLYGRLGYDFDATMSKLSAAEVSPESRMTNVNATLRPAFRSMQAGLRAMRAEWRQHERLS